MIIKEIPCSLKADKSKDSQLRSEPDHYQENSKSETLAYSNHSANIVDDLVR